MQVRLNKPNASVVKKKAREHRQRTGIKKSASTVVNEELREAFIQPKVEIVKA